MNDELSGQLAASDYTIPSYATFTLVTEHDTVRVEGESGLFTLSVPAPELYLFAERDDTRNEEGVLLAALRWQPDNLEWDGAVRVGGTVEALTVMQVGDLPITALTVLGVLLRPGARPYAAPGKPAVPMAFEDGVINADECFYTFLAPEDSPLVTLAETALMNHLHVWLSQRPPTRSRWLEADRLKAPVDQPQPRRKATATLRTNT